jgi:hypothetical protein
MTSCDDRFDLYPLNQVELETEWEITPSGKSEQTLTNQKSSIYHCDKI